MNTLHMTETQERHRWAYEVRHDWTVGQLQTSVLVISAYGAGRRFLHWKDEAIINAFALRSGLHPSRGWL